MVDLETTQAKLRTTPTAGVAGEHSAYYRRLLSSGYKGYIQGSIGGGTLYGALGLGIGALVALPLAIATGGTALWLIPALGGGLGFYGAHVFADIGKTAAIIADSADINEKRRYLLDRYYETPNDHEAAEIKRQLEAEHENRQPDQPFHWRPALVGAGIGIALAAVGVFMALNGVPFEFLAEPIHLVAESFGVHAVAGKAAVASIGSITGMLAVGTAIGGLAGSIIGIDREYIRRWLDGAELTVHEPDSSERAIAERERDIQRLTDAARRGEALAANAARPMAEMNRAPTATSPIDTAALAAVPGNDFAARPAPIPPEQMAGLPELPRNQVRHAVHADRLQAIDAAMARPVL